MTYVIIYFSIGFVASMIAKHLEIHKGLMSIPLFTFFLFWPFHLITYTLMLIDEILSYERKNE